MLTTIRQGEGYYIRATFGERLTPLEKYNYIKSSVCEALGLLPSQLIEKNRKREIVTARYICFYIAKENDLGTPRFLGLNMGGMDRTTVLHWLDLVQDLIDANDKTFLNDWNLCKHLLRSH